MKKAFFLMIIILFACIIFTSENTNKLKACGTNKVACKAVMKKEIKNSSTEIVDEADPSLYMLINPLIQ